MRTLEELEKLVALREWLAEQTSPAARRNSYGWLDGDYLRILEQNDWDLDDAKAMLLSRYAFLDTQEGALQRFGYEGRFY